MSDNLSEKQEIFVEVFCRSIEDGLPKREAIRLARDAAGYAQTTALAHIWTPKVAQAILDDVNRRIAMLSPDAVNAIENVLSNPASKGATNALAAAASILDRAGVTKKESQEITIKPESAIVILPPKAPLGQEHTDTK